MAQAVLITQCLQRDFVDLVGPHESLPNRLHVGHAEAQRLLGVDPQFGPVAQMMNWAQAQASEQLQIIHIRDWHDAGDPQQRNHLATFGEHCVGGTRGAQFVFEHTPTSNQHVIDSRALNDFEGTSLKALLENIQQQVSGPLRVGVVGVWTEAKVSFLLYDLKTRCGIDSLASCSALTASASRVQHFNALEQMQRILGVEVFSSLSEFVTWLSPQAKLRLPVLSGRPGPKLELAGAEGALTPADRDIISFLYRDSSRALLEPLTGGFSGNVVFRVASQDVIGHQQAPSVLKLGPAKSVGAERVAFERVEEILGNSAPSVRGFVDLGERAGIKYSYAGMGQGSARTLKKLYESAWPQTKIDGVLQSIFREILGPFYAAASYEHLPLLEHYGFSGRWAPSVRQKVEKVLAQGQADATIARSGERLEFCGALCAQDVCSFYERFLSESAPDSREFHYRCYTHGDLNLANVLVDARENVWLIDFAYTAPGHVLKDLAKLENDLLYICTPVSDGQSLRQALKITTALLAVEDLRQPLPESLEGVEDPQFKRAWRTLQTLRTLVGEVCREDRHPLQLHIALLRYAVHTLSFTESSDLQKQWALASACCLAEKITTTLRKDRKLRIDWIEAGAPVLSGAAPAAGRLGLTLCPGRRDRGRKLADDLQVLVEANTSQLLCLLTQQELEWAGVPQLAEAVQASGIGFRQYAIPDGGIPAFEDAQALVAWLNTALKAGGNVVIHCMGGLGRTGTLAGCLLVSRGFSAAKAIEAVRRCRGPRSLETGAQERFISQFAERMGQDSSLFPKPSHI